jgi:hypothetical protein
MSYKIRASARICFWKDIAPAQVCQYIGHLKKKRAPEGAR